MYDGELYRPSHYPCNYVAKVEVVLTFCNNDLQRCCPYYSALKFLYFPYPRFSLSRLRKQIQNNKRITFDCIPLFVLDEIAQVKNISIEFVLGTLEKTGTSFTYILVPFNDPGK